MDNELFELCKEVYEKIEWETLDRYVVTINGKSVKWNWTDAQFMEKSERFPLYTSDYLLEKLPYEVSVHVAGLEVTSNGLGDSRNWLAEWASGSGKMRFNGGVADGPLKALLKLTLALHEAGELK